MIVTAAVILDFDGHMLLGRRADNKLYGPPGGKLDEGESLRAGCIREIKEETSLRVEPHDLIELGFCERQDKDQIVFWYWVARYRGIVTNTEPKKCFGWQYLPIPEDTECIPGLRLFKNKLIGVLQNVSGTKMRMAA